MIIKPTGSGKNICECTKQHKIFVSLIGQVLSYRMIMLRCRDQIYKTILLLQQYHSIVSDPRYLAKF